ncbi:MAG: hypothetical protein GXY17_02855 [Clostridiaceae bacterium]|jgi:hypothetical protein|nr:hypothetical protein [Clostridiaceae bacterium]
MKRTNRVLGVILLVLGVLFLLKNFNIFDPWAHINIGHIIGKLWPSLFLILPGLMFHSSYFSGNRSNPGVLVPGGILLVLGITFQINMLFGGWGFMWPLYIFAVAFGLFELYIFGSREKGLLIPIGILTGLSLIFFISFSLNRIFSFNTRPYALPVVLILIGLSLVLGGKNKGSA